MIWGLPRQRSAPGHSGCRLHNLRPLLLPCLAVCAPFPTLLFEPSHRGERNYAALLACLCALPPIAALVADSHALPSLSPLQLRLLAWLAAHPRRPAVGMRRVALEEVRNQLPGLRGWVADMQFNPSLRPAAVLQLGPLPEPSALAQLTPAFHGTSFENVHRSVKMQ